MEKSGPPNSHESPQHTNHLIHETSPYLLQHAHNPVDWYPWGTEALKKAKREQKPIFLSIGYSACHWCHVMERESFEDEATAAILNQSFVSIKVDREERPDLDHIYMSAVQLMTQHGGWPMSVFLTPDLDPFYGGTYFPPDDRMGMPSFKKILAGVSNAWTTRRDEVLQSAKQLTGAVVDLGNQGMKGANANPAPTMATLNNAAVAIAHNFDPEYGGFGTAPKFFHTMDLRAALRHYRRTKDETSLKLVTLTLEHLTNGGIYDQLGGGFHRYSTDQRWLVPHFEKMLYDNALLAETFLEAYQITGHPEWARVARETLNYVLREMTSEAGVFFSTQDADSEGVEGKFYVWSRAEIFETLDKEVAETFCKVYDVTEHGNWEHTNILNRPRALDHWVSTLNVEPAWLEDTLALAQRKLYALRAQRIAPFRDEKVLVSWNGLMIQAMALGYQVLGDKRYLDTARNAANFILEELVKVERLLHVYKDGQARLTAYLDDYANLIQGLVSLFESDSDPRWLARAISLTDTMIDLYWDDKDASFYYTAKDHEALITRPKELHDGAVPSATAMAVTALVRVGKITGKTDYALRAERALTTLQGLMTMAPQVAGQLWIATDAVLFKPVEIVVAPGEDADENEEVLRKIWSKFIPGRALAVIPQDDSVRSALGALSPLTDGKSAKNKKTTAYFCENHACQSPSIGREAIETALERW